MYELLYERDMNIGDKSPLVINKNIIVFFKL